MTFRRINLLISAIADLAVATLLVAIAAAVPPASPATPAPSSSTDVAAVQLDWLRHLPRLTPWKAVDGDTVRGDIELGFNVELSDQTVRLLGYDAWETSRRRRSVEVAEDEPAKGEAATRDLAGLMADAGVDIYLLPGGRDPYGRWLVHMVAIVDGRVVHVDQYMRSRGHHRGDAN